VVPTLKAKETVSTKELYVELGSTVIALWLVSSRHGRAKGLGSLR